MNLTITAQVQLLCTDSNGCAEGMWGPQLSTEEEEQFTSIQQSLVSSYTSSQFGLVDDNVVDLVQEAFALTRYHINEARTHAEWIKVFSSWPVLQEWRPFLAHANLLMGKICSEVWAENLSDPQPVVKFMSNYCGSLEKNPSSSDRFSCMNAFLEKSSEAAEQQDNSYPLKVVIFPLLAKYFREKLDLLFITVDVSKSSLHCLPTQTFLNFV